MKKRGLKLKLFGSVFPVVGRKGKENFFAISGYFMLSKAC